MPRKNNLSLELHKVEVELDDSDMQLLHSYFCHRQGYIPTDLMFTTADGHLDHEQFGKLERLLQKLIDVVGEEVFDVSE